MYIIMHVGSDARSSYIYIYIYIYVHTYIYICTCAVFADGCDYYVQIL